MTKFQLRYLKLILHFKDRPMSIVGLIRFNGRVYLILFCLFIFCLFAGYWNPWFAVGGGTVILMTVLLDIRTFRQSVLVWPVLKQVLDWKKVSDLYRLG